MIPKLAQTWAAFAKSKDKKLKAQLLVHYLPLVKGTVKQLMAKMGIVLPPHLEYEDLLGYGIIGLMKALDRFEPSRGAKFETYARLRIRGETVDAMRSMDFTSRRSRQKAKQIREQRRQMEQKLGRPPSNHELGEQVGLSEAELCDLLSPDRSVVLSLDQPVRAGDGSESTLLRDIIPDDTAPELTTQAEINQLHKRLAEAVGELSEQEQWVIRLYYEENLTMKEIAQALGVSASWVSQLHRGAVTHLEASMEEYREPDARASKARDAKTGVK